MISEKFSIMAAINYGASKGQFAEATSKERKRNVTKGFMKMKFMKSKILQGQGAFFNFSSFQASFQEFLKRRIFK